MYLLNGDYNHMNINLIFIGLFQQTAEETVNTIMKYCNNIDLCMSHRTYPRAEQGLY